MKKRVGKKGRKREIGKRKQNLNSEIGGKYMKYIPLFFIVLIVYLVSFATSRAAVERAGLQYVPFTQPSPTK